MPRIEISEFDEEVTRGWLNEAPQSETQRENIDPIYRKKIFVSFFKKNLSEEQLKEYFSKFGAIDKIYYPRDGFGTPKGMAFITFYDEKSVDDVLANKPHQINGVQPEIKHSYSRDFYITVQKNNLFKDKIFVGGLPKSATKNDIQNFFEKCYGDSILFGITDISIPTDSLNRSKGFAFVKFTNEDLVDRITFERCSAEICGKICEIKRAECRDEDIVNKLESKSPSLSLKIQSKHENGHNGSISQISSDKPNPLRLVSSGTEKLKKFANIPLITTKQPIPAYQETPINPEPVKTSLNSFNVNPAPVKRTISAPVEVEKQNKKISDCLDSETLMNLGRFFVDTVANAIENDQTLNSKNPLSSMLISTFQQMIQNAKK